MRSHLRSSSIVLRFSPARAAPWGLLLLPLFSAAHAFAEPPPGSDLFSGDQPAQPQGEDAPRPADDRIELGGSCTATKQCAQGLRCVDSVCTDPRLGSLGESCVKTADCGPPLGCISGRCSARGGRTAEPSPPRPLPLPPASGLPDPSQMSAEEQDIFAEKLAASSSRLAGTSATFGVGLGGDLDQHKGFALGFHLSQRYSRYVGMSSLLAMADRADAGAVAGIGLHFGHVAFFSTP